MKKLLLFLSTLIIAGCASMLVPQKDYYGLTYVPKLSDIKLNGITKTVSGDMYYEDSIIAIKWERGVSKMVFIIHNKTNNTINIDWNKSAWVNTDKSAEKFMHAGEKYVDRNNAQPLTAIPSNSRITESVIPNSLVYYDNYLGWKENALLTWVSTDATDIQSKAKVYTGTSVRTILCLTKSGIELNYDFTFDVKNPIFTFKGEVVSQQ